MKVETKFHPVTITLETAQEFDYMWDALEQAFPMYEKNSAVRNFLIDTINTMGEVHNHQPSVEEINDMLTTAAPASVPADDPSTWDDQAKEIWK